MMYIAKDVPNSRLVTISFTKSKTPDIYVCKIHEYTLSWRHIRSIRIKELRITHATTAVHVSARLYEHM